VRLIFRTGTRTRIYHFENTGCLVPSMDEKKMDVWFHPWMGKTLDV
jgi:hypothetical protein